MHSMFRTGGWHAAALLVALQSALTPVRAAKAATWTWSLSKDGLDASGTLSTTNMPDNEGFVQITGIIGSRDDVAITGLQPTGTAVPGNAGFPVDNLLRVADASGTPQLTANGFGFALADGTYSNPFYVDSRSPPSYYEFFSFPPFNATSYTEVPVAFAAAPVPEPADLVLLASSLTGLLGLRRRRR